MWWWWLDVDGGGGEGESRTEPVGFTLKLHADFEEIKWMSRTYGNNGSDAAFNKSFNTHPSCWTRRTLTATRPTVVVVVGRGLRELAWSGVPPYMRPTVYGIWVNGKRKRVEVESGKISGKDWRIQTNIYGNGSTSVGTEERYNLWFYPSDDFHQYSILWTDSQIIHNFIPENQLEKRISHNPTLHTTAASSKQPHSSKTGQPTAKMQQEQLPIAGKTTSSSRGEMHSAAAHKYPSARCLNASPHLFPPSQPPQAPAPTTPPNRQSLSPATQTTHNNPK
ncbi:hypothetical protein Pint_05582 [Pistacia integerrima]|uniref:Uncharacterized protein n=1 Tax=Pistacia integerrima TaxID=434235 RepID=A0ACC0Z2Q5_9ROSI|nr:hypothetical protein Pint_05582 [Pistacia integerrima]